MAPLRASRPRWPLIDIARGAAVVAMIAYHLAWDLTLLRLIPVDVAGHPLGKVAARVIAGTFLVLVGVSLVLAHGERLDLVRLVRRIAVVAAAALIVTLASWLAFSDSYIFFGILHAIALFSVLALPFLRLNLWIVGAAAAAVAVAPLVLTQPAFDQPLLAFLGLGTRLPVTNDYIPIFPWFAAVLAGVGLGRLATRRSLPGTRPGGRAVRSLAWLGRWSLPIYLVHQPVLLGALAVVAQVVGPHPRAGLDSFLRQCERNCGAAMADAPGCERACSCVARSLQERGLWPAVSSNRLTPAEQGQVGAVAELCYRDLRRP